MGIEPIKERLERDEKLIKQTFSLYGIPKILLRNSIPVENAPQFVDDYEITPEYNYQLDKDTGEIKIIERPWQVSDDEGVPSYSLMPPPVVLSLIRQMVEVLNI